MKWSAPKDSGGKKYSGLTLADCQVPTKWLSHSPSSTGQGEENKMKKLMGQEKDREIAYHSLSRAKWAPLGGNNLLSIKNRVG